MGPASSGNCAVLKAFTSLMRLMARDVLSGAMSIENSWSRNTVRPSFKVSWNQSLSVTRSPVQLWKYSCPTTDSTAA